MKKTITRALALLLAAATLFAFTGCNINLPGKLTFSRGTVKGNTYHSDFSGLTFTAPDDWYFYSDDEISSLLGTTAEFLSDPESFEKATEGEIIDFFAVSPDETNNVNVSYTKGTVLADPDAIIVQSAEYLEEQYEQMGFTCTVKDPVARKLGEQSFKMAELDIDLGYGIMTQYFYVAKVGVYLVSVTATCGNGSGVETFEAMFS